MLFLLRLNTVWGHRAPYSFHHFESRKVWTGPGVGMRGCRALDGYSLIPLVDRYKPCRTALRADLLVAREVCCLVVRKPKGPA